MSAYQLGPEHLGAIVRFALHNPRTCGYWRGAPLVHDRAAELLACLAQTCYDSVRTRYPHGPLPGPCERAEQRTRVAQDGGKVGAR